MFQQLLMNLPYSPSLISQVGMYAGRLKKEELVRRFSFIVIALAFFMQLIAFLQPPQSAISHSPANDLGQGIKTKEDIAQLYNSDNTAKDVYNYYSVSPAVIDSCELTTVDTDTANLRFVGMQAFGEVGEQGYSYNNSRFYERDINGVQQEAFRCNGVTGDVYISSETGNLIVAGNFDNRPMDTTLADQQLAAPEEEPANNSLLSAVIDILSNPETTAPSEDLSELAYIEPEASYTLGLVDAVENAVDIEDLTLSQTAVNLTTNSEEGSQVSAKPGHTIEYRLTTTNNSGTDIRANIVHDLTDALEYSSLERMQPSTNYNDDTQQIEWSAVSIPANSSVVHTATVLVMQDLPSTAQGSTFSSSARYDLNMNSVYGNAANVELESPSIAKSIEGLVGWLPNASLTVTIPVIMTTIFVAGYFYARSRQLYNELGFVRREGGYL